MGARIVRPSGQVEPDIRRALEEFLDAQRARLAPSTRVRPGWTIRCFLGRIGKSWRLLEVANVDPG